MYRFLFFLLLTLSFHTLASGHKVKSVLPNQKFTRISPNGAYPAPIPYNQRLMTGKKVYVPTLTDAQKSEIFMRQLNRKFGIQPQAVTKKSLARALANVAKKNAPNLHPALRAAAVLTGAYFASCQSVNSTLCYSKDAPAESSIDLTTDFRNAKMEDNVSCNAYYPSSVNIGVFNGKSFGECLANASTAVMSKITLPPAQQTVQSGANTIVIRRSFTALSCAPNSTSCDVGTTVTETTSTTSCTGSPSGVPICTTGNPSTSKYTIAGVVQQATKSTLPKCPNDLSPRYRFGPFKPAGATEFRCYAGATEAVADSDYFEQALDSDPKFIDDLINNPDIGLDDFVDQETGEPDPELFSDTRFDDVSEKFSNAAESIVNGTAQSTNPTDTKTYIPPDIYNVTVNNVNQWFEGDTFTDTFTQQTIKPDDGQTPDGIPTDWTDFPGITQKQYEGSNERWASSAIQELGGKPDFKTEEETAFKEVKNFLESETPDPFKFYLADFISLPTSGQCRGFTIDASLTSQPLSIYVHQHCPPYDAWGRPLVEWFLGILTILQLFRIFQRTLEAA